MTNLLSRARKYGIYKTIRAIIFLFKSQFRSEINIHLFGAEFQLEANRAKLGVDGYIFVMQEAYEPEVLRFFDKVADLTGIFFDIGANAGYHSVYMAARYGFPVIAFEPHPKTYARLTRNLARFPQARAQLIGLSDKPARLNLREETDNGSNFLTQGEGGVDVGVERLDSLWRDFLSGRQEKRPLVKLDVEGWEARVLNGALEFIESTRPIIVCEIIGHHLERAGSSEMELRGIFSELNYIQVSNDDFANKLFLPAELA